MRGTCDTGVQMSRNSGAAALHAARHAACSAACASSAAHAASISAFFCTAARHCRSTAASSAPAACCCTLRVLCSSAAAASSAASCAFAAASAASQARVCASHGHVLALAARSRQPCVSAVLGQQLQVLHAQRLVLQLRLGVAHRRRPRRRVGRRSARRRLKTEARSIGRRKRRAGSSARHVSADQRAALRASTSHISTASSLLEERERQRKAAQP